MAVITFTFSGLESSTASRFRKIWKSWWWAFPQHESLNSLWSQAHSECNPDCHLLTGRRGGLALFCSQVQMHDAVDYKWSTEPSCCLKPNRNEAAIDLRPEVYISKCQGENFAQTYVTSADGLKREVYGDWGYKYSFNSNNLLVLQHKKWEAGLTLNWRLPKGRN